MKPRVLPREVLATARSLAIDVVTAEVIDAMSVAGVQVLLLKGPTTADWLYRHGPARAYSDSDLLVAPGFLERAEAVLDELAFVRCAPPEGDPEKLPVHGQPWMRADGGLVDLHRTLHGGVWATPDAVWSTLVGSSEIMRVGGSRARVLNEPARCLLLALHAAHHQGELDLPQATEDLARALDAVAEESWVGAAGLAAQLDAEGMFATGLRRVPAGAALAKQLSLLDPRMVSTGESGSTTPLVLGLERLATTAGLPAKLRLLRHELFPAPTELRWWSKLAQRGPLGLVAAYAGRVLRYSWYLVPSLIAWRDIRRELAAERSTADSPTRR